MKNKKIVKIAIIGWGKEGQSLANFLHKTLKNSAQITILDKNITASPRPQYFHFILGKKYLSNLNEFDVIYRSPGVPYLTKEIQNAKKAGVAITSLTNLFFQKTLSLRSPSTNHKLRTTHYPIIVAITGTKGKGTTATALAHILKQAKKKVVLAGNIGVAMSEVLKSAQKADYVVLELSSFQLQDLQYAPDVAVILPISPDHQDHHQSFSEYVKAKGQIVKNQTRQNTVVYFADNKYSKAIAKKSAAKKVAVPKSTTLFKKADIKLIGNHSYRNLIVASQVAKALKISDKTIRGAVRSFRGLPHRLELAHKTKKINYIDDSMSTNPETAVAAVKAMDKPTILILGGSDKGLDYAPIAKVLKKSKVFLVILNGQNRAKIYRALKSKKMKPQIFQTKILVEAVNKAVSLANKSSYKNVNILLSPASASFDQFKNAYERGDQFKSLVKNK